MRKTDVSVELLKVEPKWIEEDKSAVVYVLEYHEYKNVPIVPRDTPPVVTKGRSKHKFILVKGQDGDWNIEKDVQIDALGAHSTDPKTLPPQTQEQIEKMREIMKKFIYNPAEDENLLRCLKEIEEGGLPGYLEKEDNSYEYLEEDDLSGSISEGLDYSDAAAGSYNAVAAVSYAYTYWDNYNPAYRSFNDDCTNFVSQALKAGG